MSYWVAILFCVGSAFFVIGSAFGMNSKLSAVQERATVAHPFFVGSIAFTPNAVALMLARVTVDALTAHGRAGFTNHCARRSRDLRPTSPLPSDGEESPKSLVRKPKVEYVTMPDGRVERDADESHSPERLKMVAFAVKKAKEQNPSLSAADEAKIVDVNNQFNKLTLQEYIQILQSEGLLQ